MRVRCDKCHFERLVYPDLGQGPASYGQ
jgi:hypothetical protein